MSTDIQKSSGEMANGQLFTVIFRCADCGREGQGRVIFDWQCGEGGGVTEPTVWFTHLKVRHPADWSGGHRCRACSDRWMEQHRRENEAKERRRRGAARKAARDAGTSPEALIAQLEAIREDERNLRRDACEDKIDALIGLLAKPASAPRPHPAEQAR